MVVDNTLQIVDISKVDKKTGDELLNAGSSQGFLFIEGHGFSQQEIDLLFETSKQFFDLPLEAKQQCPIGSNNFGYDFGLENLDPKLQKKGDPKESINFDVFRFMNGLDPQNLPDWFKSDDKFTIIQSIINKLSHLSIKLLELLALGLDMEDLQWFTKRYDPKLQSGSTFRLLHYPGQKSLDPEAVIRAGAHTDYGSMTLLFQRKNQEGLEIYSPMSKKWEPVKYVETNQSKFPNEAPPIIVNIGDQLSYWTAGLLKSTIHRVKFPKKVQETGQDRYSIVFFSHPSDSALLEPVPSDKVKGIQGRGANNETNYLTAKQHLQKRLAATYGWEY